MQAFAESGIDPQWYLRQRDTDELLPWDHLDSGVSRGFLKKELKLALSGTSTPDCRFGECSNCGICDFKLLRNRLAQHQGGRKTATQLS